MAKRGRRIYERGTPAPKKLMFSQDIRTLLRRLGEEVK
jgi:hypothetical protein